MSRTRHSQAKAVKKLSHCFVVVQWSIKKPEKIAGL